MDFIQRIRLFQRAAETRSFSAVAREFGTTQPTVSKQIAALERELTTPLFLRTTAGLRLTDAGDRFYQRARDLLEEIAGLRSTIARSPDRPAGRLRVSCPTSFGHRFLAPLLLDLVNDHPDLQVELVLNDRWFDVVEEGIDVAVRIGPLPDARLVARRLGTSMQVCVAAPSYLAAHGAPKHAQALAQHQCLVNVFVTPEEAWSFAGPRRCDHGPGARQLPDEQHRDHPDGRARGSRHRGRRRLALLRRSRGRHGEAHPAFVRARRPSRSTRCTRPGVRQPAKVTELVRLLGQRIPKIRELGAPPRRRPVVSP
jgi:DNA-binding transcriptional LysR family regulator